MSIEETLDDRELLDVVAMLSSRVETGRLQITAGSTRGAFFFKKGKLVDAHMGPFTGFPAVNLAVSIGGPAHFSFDQTIPPPTSCFKALDERMIMRDRFGIETEGPEGSGDRRLVTQGADRPFSPSQQAALAEMAFQVTRLAIPAPKTEVKLKNIGDRATTTDLHVPVAIPFFPQSVPPVLTNPGLSRRKSDFLSSALQVLTNSSLTNSTERTLVVSAGLILSIVLSAAIGVATYWIRAKAVAPPTVGVAERTLVLPAPPVAPSTAHEEKQALAQKPAIALIRRGPAPAVKSATPLEIKDAGLLSDPGPRDNSAAASDTKVDPPAPNEERSAKPSSRAVVVVVQIDQGQVTEAYIPHHEAGLESYEATALRLARERRYGKDIKRKETITLQVTRKP